MCVCIPVSGIKLPFTDLDETPQTTDEKGNDPAPKDAKDPATAATGPVAKSRGRGRGRGSGQPKKDSASDPAAASSEADAPSATSAASSAGKPGGLILQHMLEKARAAVKMEGPSTD